MKRFIFVFFIFDAILVQASFLPSIFADPFIAQRVDKQRHLDQQIAWCKKEQPLVFGYLHQRIFKKNPEDWQELLQNFADSKTQKDREEILKTMVAWIVQNNKFCKLRKNLNDFMKAQEKKIVWVMMHGIHVPNYQKKVARQIEKFRKFRECNIDPYLIDDQKFKEK